jgi:hypothetical protein
MVWCGNYGASADGGETRTGPPLLPAYLRGDSGNGYYLDAARSSRATIAAIAAFTLR